MRVRTTLETIAGALRLSLLALVLTAPPALALDFTHDFDGDTVFDAADNCVVTPNGPGEDDQADADLDGRGDACECGDANGDGELTFLDASLVHHCVDGGAPCSALCDATGEGDCDFGDVVALVGYALGQLSKDDLSCAQGPRCVEGDLRPGCREFGAVSEHVLGRAGFAGEVWSRQRIAELGVQDYLREQLDPGSIEDPQLDAALEPYASGPFATLGKEISELQSIYCRIGTAFCTDRIGPHERINANLAEAKLLRSIHSRRQLEAVLLDFWFNHFNVDGRAKVARWAMQDYELEAIRPHVLGRFEDMVLAVTKSIAMLDYLDLRRSREGRVNENYARELMELHTVGKFGTYDEQDVQEVTRVLTGYTWQFRVFVYDPTIHDDGVKTVTFEDSPALVFDGSLGCSGRAPAAFENEGHVLICHLAVHPKTAERLSRKLIGRFVTEDPPDEFVDRVAQVWIGSGGDLAAVMEAILLSPELLSTQYLRAKVKRPSVFAASVARAIGPGSEGESLIVDRAYSASQSAMSFHGIMGDLGAMGEPLFGVAPPTGLPEDSASWSGAGGILTRLNLAGRIVAAVADPLGHWGLAHDASSEELVRSLEARLAPAGLDQATRALIIGYVEFFLGRLSPEERARLVARLILSSPEFLLH